MNVPININPVLRYHAKLPHQFLNYLLENGYQFDQGPLCLKLTGGFGSCYCSMTEFKSAELGGTMDIGYEINRHLNLITGEYIHLEHVPGQTPHLIKIQGHCESFGKVIDLKEQLEKLLIDIKILNKNSEFTVLSPDGPEPFTVVELLDHDGESMDWGLTVDADVEVDFVKTVEAEEKEKKKAEREELDRRGFLGEGRKLGGQVDRQAWLTRLQKKQRVTENQ